MIIRRCCLEGRRGGGKSISGHGSDAHGLVAETAGDNLAEDLLALVEIGGKREESVLLVGRDEGEVLDKGLVEGVHITVDGGEVGSKGLGESAGLGRVEFRSSELLHGVGLHDARASNALSLELLDANLSTSLVLSAEARDRGVGDDSAGRGTRRGILGGKSGLGASLTLESRGSSHEGDEDKKSDLGSTHVQLH